MTTALRRGSVLGDLGVRILLCHRVDLVDPLLRALGAEEAMQSDRPDEDACNREKLRVELHPLHRHRRRGQHTVGHVQALPRVGRGIDAVELWQHGAHKDGGAEVLVELLARDDAVAIGIHVLPHWAHRGHHLRTEELPHLLVADALALVHVEDGEAEHGAWRVEPEVDAHHVPEVAVPRPEWLRAFGHLAHHCQQVHRHGAVFLSRIRLGLAVRLELGQGLDDFLVVALLRRGHPERGGLLHLLLHPLDAREPVHGQKADGVATWLDVAHDRVEVVFLVIFQIVLGL
mmetsp:Transcript_17046/g.46170  ORF Transcript_17046/g.46170 Transcript_17046/m.46170 type:complete len:288 (-) Transcript_17046:235-1098(-)